MEIAKPNNMQVSGVRFSSHGRASMVTSDAPVSRFCEAPGPEPISGMARRRAGDPLVGAARVLRTGGPPEVPSDQIPLLSLLTLEGGRPRSRAEKKIKKQRRFSFRTAPLTSDPDSPSCDHSVSSGTRSEGEPS